MGRFRFPQSLGQHLPTFHVLWFFSVIFEILGSFFEFLIKNQVFADPPRFSPILVFWVSREFLRAYAGFVWFDTSETVILGIWERGWVIMYDFGLVFSPFHQKSEYFEVLQPISWCFRISTYFLFLGTSCDRINLIWDLKNRENYSTLFCFLIFRCFDVLRSKN